MPTIKGWSPGGVTARMADREITIEVENSDMVAVSIHVGPSRTTYAVWVPMHGLQRAVNEVQATMDERSRASRERYEAESQEEKEQLRARVRELEELLRSVKGQSTS